jgi:hypothetical protein
MHTLAEGYKKAATDPDVVHLFEAVLAYRQMLKDHNIEDHDVAVAMHKGHDSAPLDSVLPSLLYRLALLVFFFLVSVPGLVLRYEPYASPLSRFPPVSP